MSWMRVCINRTICMQLTQKLTDLIRLDQAYQRLSQQHSGVIGIGKNANSLRRSPRKELSREITYALESGRSTLYKSRCCRILLANGFLNQQRDSRIEPVDSRKASCSGADLFLDQPGQQVRNAVVDDGAGLLMQVSEKQTRQPSDSLTSTKYITRYIIHYMDLEDLMNPSVVTSIEVNAYK